MNNVTLTGNLTKDIELRNTNSGSGVCSFQLAVRRNYKNKDGEYETDFISCKAFRKTAELLSQHTRKGHKIGIIGYILTGSYEKQDGTKVYTTDVIVNQVEFLQGKSTQNSSNNQNQQNNYFDNRAEETFDNNGGVNYYDDTSDLPF